MGWNTGQDDILTVKDCKGIVRNVIIQHGQLTMSHVRNSVIHYHSQPTRVTQNSDAFAKFLIDLFVPHTKAEMYSCLSEGEINNICH